jgi:glycine dehydrogenase
LLQYPAKDGSVINYEEFVKKAHKNGALVACATDLLALSLLKPPGEFGVDICLGNSQRFGVPMGYGGPHAAFFSVKDALKRRIPGRLIGVSKDATGKQAYRLSLQTREQHIRREKATSNICTAQALLANMAALYAVYHGPEGIRDIAQRVHNFTALLASGLSGLGYKLKNKGGSFFDTLTVELPYKASDLIGAAANAGINLLFVNANTVSLTLDETVTKKDLQDLLRLFESSSFIHSYQTAGNTTIVRDSPSLRKMADAANITVSSPAAKFPAELKRTSKFLTHPIFNSYHSVPLTNPGN